jgi:hypothetical protein
MTPIERALHRAAVENRKERSACQASTTRSVSDAAATWLRAKRTII